MPDSGEPISALFDVGMPNSEDGWKKEFGVESLCADSRPEMYSLERHESLPLL